MMNDLVAEHSSQREIKESVKPVRQSLAELIDLGGIDRPQSEERLTKAASNHGRITLVTDLPMEDAVHVEFSEIRLARGEVLEHIGNPLRKHGREEIRARAAAILHVGPERELLEAQASHGN